MVSEKWAVKALEAFVHDHGKVSLGLNHREISLCSLRSFHKELGVFQSDGHELKPFPLHFVWNDRNSQTASKLWNSCRSLQRPGWPAAVVRHDALPAFSHSPTSTWRQETQLCHFSSLDILGSDVKSLQIDLQKIWRLFFLSLSLTKPN